MDKYSSHKQIWDAVQSSHEDHCLQQIMRLLFPQVEGEWTKDAQKMKYDYERKYKSKEEEEGLQVDKDGKFRGCISQTENRSRKMVGQEIGNSESMLKKTIAAT